MIVVFTGPTIQQEEARRWLSATYRPPAAQGDVLRALRDGPSAIGIIDGYFSSVPSVWHKEILFALQQGVRVYGAASMGALRAAELHTFGMRGIGEIFAAFRDGQLEEDDEVALIHGDESEAYQPLSEPMVNIRSTLEAAAEFDVISSISRDKLVQLAKRSFYPDRSFAMLISIAAENGVPREEIRALGEWLPGGRIDLKRRDAIEMLQVISREVNGDIRRQPRDSARFEETGIWLEFARNALELDPREIDTQLLSASPELDATHEANRLAAIARLLALETARRQGLLDDSDRLVDAAVRLRQRHGLLEPEDLDAWMRKNDLDRRGFMHLVEVEAAVAGLATALEPAIAAEYADQLRVIGTYAELRDRISRAASDRLGAINDDSA